ELGVAFEVRERLVRAQEGFLNDIGRVFGIADEPINGVEQPILIPGHQFAEGNLVSLQASGNQPWIFWSHVLLVRRGWWVKGSDKKLVSRDATDDPSRVANHMSLSNKKL